MLCEIIYILTAALQLDVIIYKHVVILLHISAFFGHSQRRIEQSKIQ